MNYAMAAQKTDQNRKTCKLIVLTLAIIVIAIGFTAKGLKQSARPENLTQSNPLVRLAWHIKDIETQIIAELHYKKKQVLRQIKVDKNDISKFTNQVNNNQKRLTHKINNMKAKNKKLIQATIKKINNKAKQITKKA